MATLTGEIVEKILRKAGITQVAGWSPIEINKGFICHIKDPYLTPKMIKSIKEQGLMINDYKTRICEESERHVVLKFKDSDYFPPVSN